MTPRRRWSTESRLRIWEAHGKCCQMCKRPTDERGFDLDHHIPLAIGGADEEGNLRPLCRPCHRMKTSGKGGDISTAAKVERQRRKHLGAWRPQSSLSRREPKPLRRSEAERARMGDPS